jgi:hypothetical protein
MVQEGLSQEIRRSTLQERGCFFLLFIESCYTGMGWYGPMGLNRSLGLEFLDGKMLETISDAGGWLENLV